MGVKSKGEGAKGRTVRTDLNANVKGLGAGWCPAEADKSSEDQ